MTAQQEQATIIAGFRIINLQNIGLQDTMHDYVLEQHITHAYGRQ